MDLCESQQSKSCNTTRKPQREGLTDSNWVLNLLRISTQQRLTVEARCKAIPKHNGGRAIRWNNAMHSLKCAFLYLISNAVHAILLEASSRRRILVDSGAAGDLLNRTIADDVAVSDTNNFCGCKSTGRVKIVLVLM